MSKWRPVELNCLFCIPDIHGQLNLFQKICDRILPLRKSDGGKDRLILLGDYIDRHVDSHKLLDYLIELKKEYKDQLILLKGNHEHLLLKALNQVPNKNYSLQDSASAFKLWYDNGGLETVNGYLNRNKINSVCAWSFSQFRVTDLIPKEHIKFLQEELISYFELENYWFVHAGCSPDIPLYKQEPELLIWDRKLYEYASRGGKRDWEPTIVCGHSGPNPIIYDKYIMLDAGSPNRLLAVELNSMEAYVAYPGNTRLVKLELKEGINSF